MIEQDIERLHRYLDGQMSEEERIEFESLLEQNPEWRTEVDEYHQIGELLRTHVGQGVESVNFDTFFDGIEQQLREQTPSDTVFVTLRRFFTNPIGALSLVTALVMVFFFMYAKSPTENAAGGPPPVVVEKQKTEGKHLIKVNKSVDKNDPTVLWLHEDDRDGGGETDDGVEAPF